MSMAHDFSGKIAWLEAQWTPPDGVIGRLRDGDIDWVEGQQLIDTILSWESQIPIGEPLPSRFVALLWSLPTYVENHRSVLESAGADSVRLSEFSGAVFRAVSTVLGLP